MIDTFSNTTNGSAFYYITNSVEKPLRLVGFPRKCRKYFERTYSLDDNRRDNFQTYVIILIDDPKLFSGISRENGRQTYLLSSTLIL